MGRANVGKNFKRDVAAQVAASREVLELATASFGRNAR